MPRLTYRERHRRINQSLAEAWKAAEMPAPDPGLRDVYSDIPRAPIRLITSTLWIDANQGGLLRVADAYRVERLDLSPEKDGARDFSGSMGANKWQPYRWVPTDQAIEEALAEGYRTYALTLSEDTVAIGDVKWAFPAAIVLGEEKKGVAPEVAARCHERIAIPMFGLMGSLNVGMAAAIAIYHAAMACHRADSSYQPVRNASRRLLGLEPADYGREE